VSAAEDTIYALSSAPGRAAIAVLRVSGPAAGAALRGLTGRPLPPPRLARLTRLRDALSGEPLDDGLVVWFPGPASETGEDVAELQIHGGRATVAALLEALGRIPGLRLAEPGEFTRRGFLNGKLDLTAVEGLADLVSAETDAQRRQALRQLRGELGRLYEGWREGLLRALAQAEAAIDFPEETEDAALRERIARQISGLIEDISQHLEDGRRGERLRDGLSVAILGPPNAGKSSLLNILAQREVAIVAETAGTTRDVLEVHLDLEGYPVTIADTAGLRQSEDAIEREGVRRALARAEHADLRLLILDPPCWSSIPPFLAPFIGGSGLIVLSKLDLVAGGAPSDVEGHPALAISAKTGEGIPTLLAALAHCAREVMDLAEAPGLTRLRHRAALERCREALRRAQAQPVPDLAAEDLRLATRELGRITGRVGVEDMLDVIFREFCIGK
jgi:tRNA modification GTPase